MWDFYQIIPEEGGGERFQGMSNIREKCTPIATLSSKFLRNSQNEEFIVLGCLHLKYNFLPIKQSCSSGSSHQMITLMSSMSNYGVSSWKWMYSETNCIFCLKDLTFILFYFDFLLSWSILFKEFLFPCTIKEMQSKKLKKIPK